MFKPLFTLVLLLTAPAYASQPNQFAYKFVMTPEEGPVDAKIESHYTAAFRQCQKAAVATAANVRCFEAEFTRQDETLNRVWRSVFGRMAPATQGSLRTAQRQWADERDPFCKSKAAEFNNGTIAPVVYIDCRVEQTIRRTIWLSALTLAPAAQSADLSGIGGLAGTWVIRKATLSHPEGVQAYSTDQLNALAGNKLILSQQSATWVVSHGQAILREHEWLADRCSAPTITHQKQGKFNIRCSDTDDFSPDGSISMLRNGDLRLDWWDSVTLYLRKVK
jgi:uncharacterized protein YecT (DUF1311 family)